jgi:hypothetical protein
MPVGLGTQLSWLKPAPDSTATSVAHSTVFVVQSFANRWSRNTPNFIRQFNTFSYHGPLARPSATGEAQRQHSRTPSIHAEKRRKASVSALRWFIDLLASEIINPDDQPFTFIESTYEPG